MSSQSRSQEKKKGERKKGGQKSLSRKQPSPTTTASSPSEDVSDPTANARRRGSRHQSRRPTESPRRSRSRNRSKPHRHKRERSTDSSSSHTVSRSESMDTSSGRSRSRSLEKRRMNASSSRKAPKKETTTSSSTSRSATTTGAESPRRRHGRGELSKVASTASERKVRRFSTSRDEGPPSSTANISFDAAHDRQGFISTSSPVEVGDAKDAKSSSRHLGSSGFVAPGRRDSVRSELGLDHPEDVSSKVDASGLSSITDHARSESSGNGPHVADAVVDTTRNVSGVTGVGSEEGSVVVAGDQQDEDAPRIQDDMSLHFGADMTVSGVGDGGGEAAPFQTTQTIEEEYEEIEEDAGVVLPQLGLAGNVPSESSVCQSDTLPVPPIPSSPEKKRKRVIDDDKAAEGHERHDDSLAQVDVRGKYRRTRSPAISTPTVLCTDEVGKSEAHLIAEKSTVDIDPVGKDGDIDMFASSPSPSSVLSGRKRKAIEEQQEIKEPTSTEDAVESERHEDISPLQQQEESDVVTKSSKSDPGCGPGRGADRGKGHITSGSGGRGKRRRVETRQDEKQGQHNPISAVEDIPVTSDVESVLAPKTKTALASTQVTGDDDISSLSFKRQLDMFWVYHTGHAYQKSSPRRVKSLPFPSIPSSSHNIGNNSSSGPSSTSTSSSTSTTPIRPSATLVPFVPTPEVIRMNLLMEHPYFSDKRKSQRQKRLTNVSVGMEALSSAPSTPEATKTAIEVV
ncbi:hypothetical protein HK102_002537 [Quaeritorhiza haematococci]|nr:hypothetical protein HK102_002537 [Quaeritorhiza haematococci]